MITLALTTQAASATVIKNIKSRSIFEGEEIQVKINGKIKANDPIIVRFLSFVDGIETAFGGTPSIQLPKSKKSSLIKITAPNVSKSTQALILEIKRQSEDNSDAGRTELVVFNKPDNSAPGPAGTDGVVSASDISAESLALGAGVTLSSNGDALLYNSESIVYKNADNTRLKGDQVDLGESILENIAGALTWNGHSVIGPDGVTISNTLDNGEDTATTLAITGTGPITLDTDGADSISLKLPPAGLIKGLIRAEYNFATDGGTAGTVNLRNGNIPDNAILTNVWYDVLTSLQSATDASQIALGIQVNDINGIIAPTAISAGGNIWDQGFHSSIVDGQAANFANKTTDERNIQLSIIGEALTAGKINIFAEYVISE